MAVQLLSRDARNRYERVALLLSDRSVWQLDEVIVPHRENSLTLRACAWSLRQERTGRCKHGAWRQLSPAEKREAEKVAQH